MPCRYVIDKERRLVTTTGSGVLTFAEAWIHQHQLTRDPNFNPDFFQLLDATRVTQLEISSAEMKALASRQVFSARSRRAIVTSHLADYGMGRSFQTYRELAGGEEQIEVFRDMQSALEWLGLPKSSRVASR